MGRKSATDSTNKSAAIREIFASHPNAKASEIVADIQDAYDLCAAA